MNRSIRIVSLWAVSLLLLASLAGCSDRGNSDTEATPPVSQEESAADDQPMGDPPEEPDTSEPESFLDEILSSNYADWKRAPGYEELAEARGPHGDEVQIFLDPTAEKALEAGGAEWPEETLIVKDIYRDGKLIQIAAMKKVGGGWYWGEWDAEGNEIVEGQAAEPCQGCHADGTDGTLGVSLEAANP